MNSNEKKNNKINTTRYLGTFFLSSQTYALIFKHITETFFLSFQTYALIFKHITETNLPTVIMSLICMAILYSVKVHVNQRFKDRMKFPVPIELFVVSDLFECSSASYPWGLNYCHTSTYLTLYYTITTFTDSICKHL